MGKIQTGLRIPEALHEDLQCKANKIGVSVNQLILMLLSMGLRLYEEGIIPQSE